MESDTMHSRLDGPPRILAAVDIGSNTVKMTVAQRGDDGSLAELHHDAETVRLGAGIANRGELDPARAERAIATLKRFADTARAFGAEGLIGVATEAIRHASDGARFLDQAQRETGWKLNVISGADEATLTFEGLRKIVSGDANALIADIGGGSTEFIWTKHGSLSEARSLPIGSGRLTDKWLKGDPPTTAEYTACLESINESLAAESGLLLQSAEKTDRLVISGGTGTYLGALIGRSEHIDLEALQSAVSVLTRIPSGELAHQLAIPLERARVLPAGAAVVAVLQKRIAPTTIAITESGLRRALLAREFNRHSEPIS
jgi:exopolyphosphatase/guanosine-5'-triphosphate,3'-diphosphate pyrophosphatase